MTSIEERVDELEMAVTALTNLLATTQKANQEVMDRHLETLGQLTNLVEKLADRVLPFRRKIDGT